MNLSAMKNAVFVVTPLATAWFAYLFLGLNLLFSITYFLICANLLLLSWMHTSSSYRSLLLPLMMCYVTPYVLPDGRAIPLQWCLLAVMMIAASALFVSLRNMKERPARSSKESDRELTGIFLIIFAWLMIPDSANAADIAFQKLAETLAFCVIWLILSIAYLRGRTPQESMQKAA